MTSSEPWILISFVRALSWGMVRFSCILGSIAGLTGCGVAPP